MDFEKKMKEIEETIQKLESGELNLDDSIKLYTQAMQNCNECSKYINEAKGKVEVLSVTPTEEPKTEE